MALQIQKEFFSNPNCLVFHTKLEISQTYHESFDRPLRPSSEKYLKEVGERGAMLVRKVVAIPGVVQVRIEPYSLSVTRDSSLFSWEEISGSVDKILGVLFGGEKEEVRYMSLSEFPLIVIFAEPFKRLGKLARNAWPKR